jgi:cytochrome c oxidase cbb3-type subunit 4
VAAGTIRGLVTLALLLAFVGLVIWAFSRRRKADFDEMAELPFHEYPSDKEQGSKSP